MSTGFVVLLDCPNTVLTVDGVAVKLKGGFRGFHGVPPGLHVIELEYYTGDRARIEVETAAGEATVYEFFNQPPRLEPADEARARPYREQARSGGMGPGLWAFPPAGMAPGTEWVAPEAAGSASGGPAAMPAAPTLPETPQERRRYYATVSALTAAAIAVGYFLAGAVVRGLDMTAGSIAERLVYGTFIMGPLALVAYVVVRSRGFRLVR